MTPVEFFTRLWICKHKGVFDSHEISWVVGALYSALNTPPDSEVNQEDVDRLVKSERDFAWYNDTQEWRDLDAIDVAFLRRAVKLADHSFFQLRSISKAGLMQHLIDEMRHKPKIVEDVLEAVEAILEEERAALEQ